MRVTFLSTLFALAIMAPLARAQGNVIVVANAGYFDLQHAIDAAVDGDTIIVRNGTFGDCVISGKGLSIIADPELSATVHSFQVSALPAGGVAILAGFHVPGFGVRVDNCAGRVRLIGLYCSSSTALSGTAGLSVDTSNDVAAVRCTLHGGE